jgi:hypothetical protein
MRSFSGRTHNDRMASQGLTYLDPKRVRFWKASAGAASLRCEIEEERCILSARLRRAFPVSARNQHISIGDASGKEIGILPDLEGLDQDSKRLVVEDLERRYYTPHITAIHSLRQEGGIWTFEVSTQRGPIEFHVRNWRDSSHEIAPGRWQIHSVDGVRYEIPNLEALDARSKILLEQVT